MNGMNASVSENENVSARDPPRAKAVVGDKNNSDSVIRPNNFFMRFTSID